MTVRLRVRSRSVPSAITIEQLIHAPRERVWADIADLSSHVEWMGDAESIRFLGDATGGVGARLEVATRVGPLRTVDVMELTAWQPPERMAIRHEGLVSGDGEFVLEVRGDDTLFRWTEHLRFPLRLGGRVGELAARPVLRAVWRRNLGRLARRF